jgi:hypothetical protein
MNIKFKSLIFCLLFLGLFISPFFALAQGQDPPGGDCPDGQLCNPIPNIGSIPILIKTILEGIIKIGIPIIALAIIYSGFLFVFARGNSEQLKKAKSALMYTLIGGAVLLGSWAIAQLISETVLAL